MKWYFEFFYFITWELFPNLKIRLHLCASTLQVFSFFYKMLCHEVFLVLKKKVTRADVLNVYCSKSKRGLCQLSQFLVLDVLELFSAYKNDTSLYQDWSKHLILLLKKDKKILIIFYNIFWRLSSLSI